ncbi:hypothetical protein M885DRAFT_509503 [Pelagophyceae sp. CCMP2097]|nr:hypothetical protein M885DRAFT_509503 [Pelagophyceae sp. CCMP2097]
MLPGALALLLARLAVASPQAADGRNQWDAAAAAAYAALSDAARGDSIEAKLPKTIDRRGDAVVYAAGGGAGFWRQEVLPTARYLTRLGVKNDAGIKYYLLAERPLLATLEPADAKMLHALFDTVATYEDVAVLPRYGNAKLRVKSVKLHALLFNPFRRFVYLDFDSRPCRFDFGSILLRQLAEARVGGSKVDALLHNQWEAIQSRLDVSSSDHMRIEHNSAIAAFDASTRGTAAFLEKLLPAFDSLKSRRDQPAMMVALRYAFESGFLHKDVDSTTFCRRNTSSVVSCDAGCLVVHKPAKYDPGALVVAVGDPGTGAEALQEALAALQIDRAPCLWSFGGHNDQNCRVLVGAEWAKPDAYTRLAQDFPRAKFILTTSARPCKAERDHVADVVARLEPHRLFRLDVSAAAARGESVWLDLCGFLEAWSPCKVRQLRTIARKWRRTRVHAPCGD